MLKLSVTTDYFKKYFHGEKDEKRISYKYYCCREQKY